MQGAHSPPTQQHSPPHTPPEHRRWAGDPSDIRKARFNFSLLQKKKIYSPLSGVLLLTSTYTKTSFCGMFCVSTRKQHLQPDSDPVVQLGQAGRGKWHQMAERGSLPPFHKGGLQLPPGLCAPKMTSPASLGEVPTAASRGEGGFLGAPALPLRHPPRPPLPPASPGIPPETAHPRWQELGSRSCQTRFKWTTFRRARG